MIDKSGSCAAGNLHAVWDNCLVERRVLVSKRLAQEHGWSTFTRSYRAAEHLLDDTSESDVEDWLGSGVIDWARESFDILRQPELKYCVKTPDGCAYTKDNFTLDTGEPENIVIMSDAYLDRYADIAATQLTKAGIRLGAMITEALDGEQ